MEEKNKKAKLPHYTGHRKRLREKYLQSAQSLADYELLELLLTYSIPRRDVKPLSKKLIARYGSVSGVLNASTEELTTNEWLSDNSVALILLIRDLASKIFADEIREKDLFLAPKEVLEFVKAKLAGYNDEAFLIIYVNAKNRMENFEIISEGTVDHIVIYPRKVIKQALKHNATGMIIVHNHPSGESDPSSADIRFTESLKKAANAMEIKLLDHIIIAGNNYFSFLEEQIL